VVGGTKFQGGTGSLWGTLGGVLAFAVLRNGMDLIHVEPFYVSVIIGVCLIVVLLIDKALGRA
jgi:ribose transport system permease protein